MQAQMEAKLMSMGLKSPGLKAPASPSARNFSNSGSNNNFLTPEAALGSPAADAAATLAQQRARLKASNADAASRRISAPGTLSNTGDGRNVWQPPQLGQVAERAPSPVAEQTSPSPEPTAPSSARPKSTDFTGVANQFKSRTSAANDLDGPGQDVLSPMGGGNWASMVNTPLVPMFSENKPNLDSAASKLSTWTKSNSTNGRIALADAKAFRRTSKGGSAQSPDSTTNGGVYGDDGNLLVPGSSQSARNSSGNKNSNNNSATFSGQGWGGMQARSPALSAASSNRYGNQEDLAAAAAAAAGMPFGMGLGGSPGMPLGMSPLMGSMNGMGGLGAFNMNMMNLGMMDPIQAQYLAAQIAAGQLGNQFAGMGQNPQMMMGGRGGNRGPARSTTGAKSSQNGRDSGKEKDDEVDPALLNDIPAWLRSLRLHKYTPNFEGMTWREMVTLNEDALEAKGVAALGARRKMLKTFEAVRNKMGISMPGEDA